MMNTMMNVTIVVLVLITNCHVSEKPKSGPVTPQITITRIAVSDAHTDPANSATRRANAVKRSLKVFFGEALVFVGCVMPEDSAKGLRMAAGYVHA